MSNISQNWKPKQSKAFTRELLLLTYIAVLSEHEVSTQWLRKCIDPTSSVTSRLQQANLVSCSPSGLMDALVLTAIVSNSPYNTFR